MYANDALSSEARRFSIEFPVDKPMTLDSHRISKTLRPIRSNLSGLLDLSDLSDLSQQLAARPGTYGADIRRRYSQRLADAVYNS